MPLLNKVLWHNLYYKIIPAHNSVFLVARSVSRPCGQIDRFHRRQYRGEKHESDMGTFQRIAIHVPAINRARVVAGPGRR